MPGVSAAFGELVFNLTQIDTLAEAGSREPGAGQFLVLVGDLTNPTADSIRIKGGKIKLQVEGTEYELKGEASRDLKPEYGDIDFPGYFDGQTIDAGETAPTFLLFDVPAGVANAALVYDGNQVAVFALDFTGRERAVAYAYLTPTPTFTPSVTPTPAPTVHMQLGALAFDVERVETMARAGSHEPERGQYLVLVGVLTNPTTQSIRIKGGELTLLVDGEAYELDGDASGDLKPEYDNHDFPGHHNGQTIESEETDPTFMVFDVPVGIDQVALAYEGERLEMFSLGFKNDERAVAFAQITITPSATPTMTPTHTPRPSRTPRPTATITNTRSYITVTASSSAVNLRAGPGTNYDIVGALDQGDTVYAYSRDASGNWLMIDMDGLGRIAWVAVWVVEVAGEVSILPLATAPPAPTSGWIPPTWTPALAQPQATQPVVDACMQRTCSSFSSCAEVRAHLAACPQWGSDLDWDGDGVPCDALCGSGGGQPPPPAPVPTQPPAPGVTCQHTTCGEMTSCEEAYACLRAGNSRLDRDNDGVPCEIICPGG